MLLGNYDQAYVPGLAPPGAMTSEAAMLAYCGSAPDSIPIRERRAFNRLQRERHRLPMSDFSAAAIVASASGFRM